MIDEILKNKIMGSIQTEPVFCVFDNNNVVPAGGFKLVDFIAAWGVSEYYSGIDINEMTLFTNNRNAWTFGYLSYDLKNQIFPFLHSANPDFSDMQNMFFFRPANVLYAEGLEWYFNDSKISVSDIDSVLPDLSVNSESRKVSSQINLTQRMSKDDYKSRFDSVKEHLRKGDIYEMNLCMEFYAEQVCISPVDVWKKLVSVSPTPHACLFRNYDKWLICSSPERYIMKKGNNLMAQPIKGTSKRGTHVMEDERLKHELYMNPKERAENVMIVDLMRNDLARCSIPGSVQIHELFGIYTFRTVHQMISTITSIAREDICFGEIIKNTFPMGSMTGCPKISSMKIIDELEQVSRGIFSGTAGFIMPHGDFDFNVIIRSIIYNAEKKYLSFQAGSAITWNSVMEEEYNECILKAEAMRRVLTLTD